MFCFSKNKNQKRAENGTRTRDPNLGKVVLYQLSYFRNVLLAKVGTLFILGQGCALPTELFPPVFDSRDFRRRLGIK